jgi:Tfp pilus assembly protein PilF
MRARLRPLLFAAAAVSLAACETTPPAPPPPATQSIVALYQRPAERALINGIRSYEEGSFDRAEAALRSALAQGLADPRDNATAHKYLAFLACAFSRLGECEQHFRDAFAADANFSLTETEVGHPIWGPIYRKVAAAQPPQAAVPTKK